MPTYEGIRIEITKSNDPSGIVACSSLEVAPLLTGADQCNGGTITAGSVASGSSAANAIDLNPATDYISDSSGGPQYLQVMFPAPSDIQAIRWRSRNSIAGQNPRDFQVFVISGGVPILVAVYETLPPQAAGVYRIFQVNIPRISVAAMRMNALMGSNADLNEGISIAAMRLSVMEGGFSTRLAAAEMRLNVLLRPTVFNPPQIY